MPQIVHLIAGRLGVRVGAAGAAHGDVATSLVGIRGGRAIFGPVPVSPETLAFQGSKRGRSQWTRQVERGTIGLPRQSWLALCARAGAVPARRVGYEAFACLSQLVSTLEVAVDSEVEGEKVGEEGSQLMSSRHGQLRRTLRYFGKPDLSAPVRPDRK